MAASPALAGSAPAKEGGPGAAERPRSHSQPLLWAAAAYTAGVLLGSQAWRPATQWIAAACVFLLAAAFFRDRRPAIARALVLAAICIAGALNFQLQPDPAVEIGNDPAFAQLTDGREVTVTGHVVRDGIIHGAAGNFRQSVDVEAEEAQAAGVTSTAPLGIRLSVYSLPPEEDTGEPASLNGRAGFPYGQRLRFTAKLRRPRNFRNPGAFDYRGFLTQQNIVALASVAQERVELLRGGREHWPLRRLHQARRSILRQVNLLWPPAEAALMAAMLIGDRRGMDHEITLNYQRTGAYHLLVVAGLKVGILAFSLLWIFKRLRVPGWVSTLMTIAACILYTQIAEANAPVVRATVMLSIYLAASFFYRDRNPLNAIGAAALGMMAWSARSLFDVGFQLSFISILAIAAIAMPLLARTANPYRKALQHFTSRDYDLALAPRMAQFRLDLRLIAQKLAAFVPEPLSRGVVLWPCRAAISAFDVVVLSTVLQVSLALPMALYFHRAMALSLPANALVVPLHALLMPLAGSALLLGYASPLLAHPAASAAALVLHATNAVINQLAGLRWHGLSIGDLRVATPGLWPSLFATAAWVAAVIGVHRRRRLAVLSLLAMSAAAVWIAIPPRTKAAPGVLEITAIDVGQGDSLLLISPEGKALLIDAGGQLGMPGLASSFDPGEEVVSPYLWSRGITRLDAVALTHAHSDHIGGMRSVIANFRPRELWLGPVPDTAVVRALLGEAKRDGVAIVERAAGEAIAFGRIRMLVLGPPASWTPRNDKAGNNDSLVLQASYKNTAVLLEGDAEKKVERMLAQSQPQPNTLHAGLLKVAHHGSASSTTAELLGAVHPQFAIISVGYRTSFRHPRPEVLARLQAAGVETYRTDTLGAITFYLDGKTISAKLPSDH